MADSLGRETCVAAKGRERRPDLGPGADVADESEEVPGGRVQEPQRRRVALATLLVRVVPDRLQADHRRHAVAARPDRPSVDEASHLGLLEVQLLVGERDEAQGAREGAVGEPPGEDQQGGGAARVVVGSRAAHDRVVVGASHHDLPAPARAGPLHLEVVAGLAGDLVGLTPDPVTGAGQRRVEVVGGAGQAAPRQDVALADPAGQRLDVAAQFLRQPALGLGERGQRPAMARAGHAEHRDPGADGQGGQHGRRQRQPLHPGATSRRAVTPRRAGPRRPARRRGRRAWRTARGAGRAIAAARRRRGDRARRSGSARGRAPPGPGPA